MTDCTPSHLRWTKAVPETVSHSRPFAERQYRCEGCGQLKPESDLMIKRFAGGRGMVRVCEKGNCWAHYRRANKC